VCVCVCVCVCVDLRHISSEFKASGAGFVDDEEGDGQKAAARLIASSTWQRLLRQHLHSCTSKASKVSTEGSSKTDPHHRPCSFAGVSICTRVLVKQVK
jgi:hypothetical protein